MCAVLLFQQLPPITVYAEEGATSAESIPTILEESALPPADGQDSADEPVGDVPETDADANTDADADISEVPTDPEQKQSESEAPDPESATEDLAAPAAKTNEAARATIADGYYRIAPAGRADASLDARSGGIANGTALQLYSNNGTDAQVWHIRATGIAGQYTIESAKAELANKKRAVDIPGGNAVNQARLQLYDANGTAAQTWIAQQNDDGTVSFLSAANPKRALDLTWGSTANGTLVQLYDANSSAAQKWTLSPTKTSRQKLDELASQHKGDLADGTYTFRSGISNAKALDISGGSFSNGANAQIWDSNGTDAQYWIVSHDAKGYVTLTNKNSKKVLDVAGGNTSNGANVQQYQSNGTYSQKWVAVAQDGGTVKLISALDPSLALDIAGGSSANGANAQLYTDNGSAAQRWAAESTEAARKQLDDLAASHKNAIPAGTYYIQSSLATRKVLDISGGSKANGANAQLYATNLSAAQKWKVTYDNTTGYATIQNIGSGKVLDVSGGKAYSKANVQQYSSNGSWAQKWIIEPLGNASSPTGYRIVSAIRPGYALDIAGASTANGANAQLSPTNGAASQSFAFIPITASVAPCDNIIADGWYTLAASGNTNYAVDISSGSTANGANAQIYKANGTAAQLFRFTYRNGYYQIINANSGKALDVDGGNPLPPTNVQLWNAGASNANQLFSAVDNGDGTYTFINKETGLALDIQYGNLANGTNLDAYTPNGSAAQKFKLLKQTSLIKEGLYNVVSQTNGQALLDVQGGSSADTAQIQLYASNGSFAQKWYFMPVNGQENTYTIECLGSGKYLTAVSGNSVAQRAASNAAEQQWVPDIQDGLIVLRNKANGNVLGVAKGASGNGAKVGLFTPNANVSQQFKLKTADALPSGTYVIKNMADTSKVIDIASGSNANGANIQLYSANGTSAQKWDIWKNADGTYLIKNAANGKSLDVLNAGTASGTNVQLWQKQGNAAQKWTITYEHGKGFRIASALNPSLVLSAAQATPGNGTNAMVSTDAGAASQRFSFSETQYTPSILNSVQWKGAAHYSKTRYDVSTWQALVIHISECTTLQQITNTFWGSREASAHYGVGPGQVAQYVNLNDTAWAVGNWEWNKRTVSIEHVGTTANPPSRATLDTSAQLMAALARTKGWTELVMGKNVGIHKWYGSTSCPATLDVRYLVSKANEYMGNGFTYKEVTSGDAKPASRSLFGMETMSLRDALAMDDLNGHGSGL